MKNITYFLGAGASHYSIPTYVGFRDGFSKFVKEVQENFQNRIESDDKLSSNEKGEISTLLKTVQEGIKNGTPDLYANKLYARGDSESRKKLKELKILISLYLLFEQLPRNRDLSMNEIDIENYVSLDNRYEYFLGTVLDRYGDLKDGIKIVSWNYDMQIEIAYCERMNASLNDAIKKLGILSGKTSFINSPHNIVKLNGTAGLFTEDDVPRYIIRFPGASFDSNTLRLFYNIMSTVALNNPFRRGQFQPQIYFAWEENDQAIHARDKGKKIMAMSDILVIIGYSFHQFNAAIDRELLNAAINLQKIYLQVHPNDYESVKQKLSKMLLGRDIEIISASADLTQFYIPPDFYD